MTRRNGSRRGLALDLRDGAFHSVAGVHGVSLLCWPGKVRTLVPGHDGVLALCRAVEAKSMGWCGLAGQRRRVRGMGVISILAEIRERFRMSPTSPPTTAGSEIAIEGCAVLPMASPGSWREGGAGCWFGERVAGQSMRRRFYREPGRSAWWWLQRAAIARTLGWTRFNSSGFRCTPSAAGINARTSHSCKLLNLSTAYNHVNSKC